MSANHTPIRRSSSSVCNKKPLYLFVIAPMRTYISPQGLIEKIQSFYWGLESILVSESKDPKVSIPDCPALLTYIIGLKNPVYTFQDLKILLLKEFRPLVVGGKLHFMKVKGWGKVCSMFPDPDVYPDADICIWGMSSEEYEARRYATSKKVGFHLAKMIISRALRRKEPPLPSAAAIEEPPRSAGFLEADVVQTPTTLEEEDQAIYIGEGPLSEPNPISSRLSRLRDYVKALGAPSPYSVAEIGRARFEVLKWLGYNLLRPLGDEQLLLLGRVKGEIPGFIRLLEMALKVCFVPPRLNNWVGVNNARDVTVISGISNFAYSDRAEEESACRTNLIRFLDGELGLYEWGARGEHAFRNEVKTPVILVPALPEVPVTLRSAEFESRLRVVEWKAPPLFDVMPVGRMAATILHAAEAERGEQISGPIEFHKAFTTFQHISDFNKGEPSV